MRRARPIQAPSVALGTAWVLLLVASLVAQIDALVHRDRYDRLIPLELPLPFQKSLYLRDGVCVRSSGSYNYDEFTAGRSQAIEPSTNLYLLRLEILERLGFHFQIDRWTSGPLAGWSVAIPFWFVISATVLPATSFVRRVTQTIRARNRRRHGRCERCGYDLRGTPDRCPECGDAPARSAAQ